ncbi:Excinuclease ABC subunit C [Halovenus aranensis]|uniref:UvrABC system protein C n=1 Tax=Halovenus aranensis TaxID=890420 RepID=A0A1G8YE81_9EURY|nr:excinuclease ABC subunit C [Halovenus aranensis]SDK01036.1 Excinuclease ABC subunit C [Halovenus aranensis]
MDSEAVRQRANDLPTEPGVYQFLDGDRVLYVGKAVDLRDRVRSYADHGDVSGSRSERIRQMVAHAREIEVAVTETESQALLLEANLIKRHRPRYNVRLKDDKSYPLVELTGHEFPQIRVTRDPESGSTVFGPFTDRGQVESVVKALRDVYGLRGCSDHKYSTRDRPCLDYDIGLCTAPCTDEIDRESYVADVGAVERFFGGETGVLTDPLRREMEAAAEAERFERAANLRDTLSAVESFQDASAAAVNTADGTRRQTDVLGVSLAGDEPTVAVLRAEGGQLVGREQHTLDAPEAVPEPATVLGAFLPQYYAAADLPDVILCPEQPAGGDIESWLEGVGVALRVPGAGREATLVDLAMKNASRPARDRDETTALAAALGIDAATRIEGFDVSHTQGRSVVGSNVVFVDGTPEKSAYRRRRLTETNDDYGNMAELVGWRAQRAQAGNDDRPQPDLLLIDGGHGQLDAARDALDGWDVPVIALAKAEERVVTPDRTYNWPSDDPKLHLLQRVRDEAHRFAVQYHETVRDDVSTPLDEISGVGPETRKRLLGRFGSVEGVRTASTDELTSVEGVGEKTATRLTDQL